jgi:hypothetical protein
MPLTQIDYVVQTLAADRSDQPFSEAVLLGRGWCNRLVADTHGAQSAHDNGAVDHAQGVAGPHSKERLS